MSPWGKRVFERSSRLAAKSFAIAALLCVPRSAHANGRYPKADQLQVAPDDPQFLAVRTTFGLLVSHDSGQNWDWICERAIGYSGVQDPTLGLMKSGTLIASLTEGIARSTDWGCNWAFSDAPLSGSPVIDLTVFKGAPNRALALVWDAQRIGYSSRILASDDNGRSFEPYGTPIDPAVLVTTLDVAPSDSHHVYASGTRAVDGVRAALLFASDDDGQHWSEYSLPFDPKLEQGVYIAAVDPEDANTVYVRTSSATVSRLLVSHDGGKTASVIHSGSLLAFALSPDGKQLYFGGEDGLYGGPANGTKFEPRASLRVLCLAATASTVYACSDEHSGFTLGASADGGSTFEPLLHLKTVRGPLSCSADTCETDWPLVRAQLGIALPSETDAGAGEPTDASTSDAGAESEAGATSPHEDAGNDAANTAGSSGAPSTEPPKLSPRGSCAVGFGTDSSSCIGELLLTLLLGRLSVQRRSRARSRHPAK